MCRRIVADGRVAARVGGESIGKSMPFHAGSVHDDKKNTKKVVSARKVRERNVRRQGNVRRSREGKVRVRRGRKIGRPGKDKVR